MATSRCCGGKDRSKPKQQVTPDTNRLAADAHQDARKWHEPLSCIVFVALCLVIHAAGRVGWRRRSHPGVHPMGESLYTGCWVV